VCGTVVGAAAVGAAVGSGVVGTVVVAATGLLTATRVVVVATELRVVTDDAPSSCADLPEAEPQPARMPSEIAALAARARREFILRIAASRPKTWVVARTARRPPLHAAELGAACAQRIPRVSRPHGCGRDSSPAHQAAWSRSARPSMSRTRRTCLSYSPPVLTRHDPDDAALTPKTTDAAAIATVRMISSNMSPPTCAMEVAIRGISVVEAIRIRNHRRRVGCGRRHADVSAAEAFLLQTCTVQTQRRTESPSSRAPRFGVCATNLTADPAGCHPTPRGTYLEARGDRSRHCAARRDSHKRSSPSLLS
jgi:hypothetical protein